MPATPTNPAAGHSVETFGVLSTNATRNAGVLHRDAITAIDALATPAAIETTADVTTGGQLNFNTNYKVNYSASNRWGNTICPTAANRTTADDSNETHAIRATIPQVAGATHYDLFLSTDAAPKWVARITEAQRASGCIVTAVATVTTEGTAGANLVDIRVVGTGVASTAAPFDVNNAYTPADITPVDCTGFAQAKLLVKLAVTDLRSLPTCKVAVFTGNQLSEDDWHLLSVLDLAPLTAVGKPLLQELDVDVHGATGLVCVVHTLTGQGAAVSVWVELA